MSKKEGEESNNGKTEEKDPDVEIRPVRRRQAREKKTTVAKNRMRKEMEGSEFIFVPSEVEKRMPLGNEEPEGQVLEPPRPFQLDMFNKALQENIIMCAPTGIGKTRVAVMLIEKFIRDHPKKKIFFLVNKVILVHQQKKYIQKFLKDVRVGKLYGELGVDFWAEKKWNKHLKRFDIFVATAQIIFNCLTTSFIKMNEICLLIFDECHHCTKNSPYNRIMQEFYYRCKGIVPVPKIFGMTASPWTFSIGKLNTGYEENRKKCMIVQSNMDSRVEIVDTEDSVDFYARPNLSMAAYRPHLPASYKSLHDQIKQYRGYYDKLEACEPGVQFPFINQFLLDLTYLINSLGRWALMSYLRASREGTRLTFKDDFLSGLTREEKIFRKRVINHFTANYDFVGAEREIRGITSGGQTHEVTHKVKKLYSLLVDHSTKQVDEENKRSDFCGIIFVERRIASKILTDLVRMLRVQFVRVQCLYGHGSRKKLTQMQSKEQEQIMRNFGSMNLYNLLISTNVAEEGIDIQACNVVIRFDLFPDLRSFMQSRGRARKKKSDYVIMYNEVDPAQAHLCQRIQACEQSMIETCKIGTAFTRQEVSENPANVLVIESTGAKVSLSGAVSLINNICSLLPGDAFFAPRAVFTVYTYSFGFMAEMKLPSNSPIKKKVTGMAQRSKKLAKASAALEGLRELVRINYLSDKLVPKEKLKEKTKREAFGSSRIPKTFEVPYPRAFSDPRFINDITNRKKEYAPRTMYFYYFRHIHKPGERDFRFAVLTSKKVAASCIVPFGCYYFPYEFDEYKIVRGKSEKKLTRIQMAYLKAFHHYIFSNLLNLARLRIRTGQSSLKHYLIVPVKGGLIDWDLVVDTHTTTKKPKRFSSLLKARVREGRPLSLFEVQEMTVRTTYNLKYSHHWNIYEVLNFTDKTPLTEFPDEKEEKKFATYFDFYTKKHHLKDVDDAQKMLFARHIMPRDNVMNKERQFGRNEGLFLLPQYLEILPFDRKTFDAVRKIPFFMQFIENSFRIVEFCELFYTEKFLNEDVFKYMKEAFTLPQVDMYYNYERLEFLGDCILKWIAGESYFFSEPHHHEGLLHDERTLVICNNNLFDLLSNTGILEYHVIFENIRDALRCFRPPGYGKVKSVKLSSKQVADICESLIGSFYMSKGLDGVFKFLKWLKFQSLEEDYRYHKPLVTQHHIQLYMLYKLDEVEKKLGYKFKNKALLIEALTHPSFQLLECYQRLEFLGDGVLDFITTQHIFEHEKYKNLRNAGKLSLIRSVYVKNNAFSVWIIKEKIFRYVIHNNVRLKRLLGEFEDGKKGINEVPKMFGDVFESLCGAVYIDCNYSVEKTRDIFIDKVFEYKVPQDVLDSVLKEPLDYLLKKYLREKEKELLVSRYDHRTTGNEDEGEGEGFLGVVDKVEEEKLEKRIEQMVSRITVEDEVGKEVEEIRRKNPEKLEEFLEDDDNDLDVEEEAALDIRIGDIIAEAEVQNDEILDRAPVEFEIVIEENTETEDLSGEGEVIVLDEEEEGEGEVIVLDEEEEDEGEEMTVEEEEEIADRFKSLVSHAKRAIELGKAK